MSIDAPIHHYGVVAILLGRAARWGLTALAATALLAAGTGLAVGRWRARRA